MKFSSCKFQKQNVCFWFDSPPPQWARASSVTRILYHTKRRTTVSRTPLDKWSARRRNLWQQTTLTTDKHPCPPGGIRTYNLRRRARADLRLRRRGHWDQQKFKVVGQVTDRNITDGSIWLPSSVFTQAQNCRREKGKCLCNIYPLTPIRQPS